MLGHLSGGPAGFRDLSRGIAGDQRLRALRPPVRPRGGRPDQPHGDEGPPVGVSYALTERGRALMPALEQIAEWAKENLPADG